MLKRIWSEIALGVAWIRAAKEQQAVKFFYHGILQKVGTERILPHLLYCWGETQLERMSWL